MQNYTIFSSGQNDHVKPKSQKAYYPAKNQYEFVYSPNPGDIPDSDIQMTGGNKYHENTNPTMHKMINSIQGDLRISVDIQSKMRGKADRLFDEFKDNKQKYMDTLLEGETKGFCQGIKSRQDPTLKYK